MKISKVLKVLGAAAAIAALTPYRVEKDEETGATTLTALLWSATHTPATEETGRNVDVTVGLNIPGQNDEAELFADGEPEAAVLDTEEVQIITDEAQEAAGDDKAEADESSETGDATES